jgi:hypothetical protein
MPLPHECGVPGGLDAALCRGAKTPKAFGVDIRPFGI